MKKISCDGTKETGSHWSAITDEKQIICIDFDHTISKKCMACDDKLNGDGIQDGARDSIIALSKKFRIWIYSGTHPDYKPRKIEEFLQKHDVPYERVVRTKPPAIFIIDDRAIHHTSWKNTLKEIDGRLIDGFKLKVKSLEKIND